MTQHVPTSVGTLILNGVVIDMIDRMTLTPTTALRDAMAIILDDGQWWRVNAAGDAWVPVATGTLPADYPTSLRSLRREMLRAYTNPAGLFSYNAARWAHIDPLDPNDIAQGPAAITAGTFAPGATSVTGSTTGLLLPDTVPGGWRAYWLPLVDGQGDALSPWAIALGTTSQSNFQRTAFLSNFEDAVSLNVDGVAGRYWRTTRALNASVRFAAVVFDTN